MRSVAGRLFSRRKRAISAGNIGGAGDFGDARPDPLRLGLERRQSLGRRALAALRHDARRAPRRDARRPRRGAAPRRRSRAARRAPRRDVSRARSLHGSTLRPPAGLERRALRRGKIAIARPAAGERQPREPSARAADREKRAHREVGREAIERRPPGEECPKAEPASAPSRASDGARIRARANERIIFGSGIRIGQTASQRPQKVEAFGKWPPSSTPISDGVSTAPIGPG